MAEHYGNDGYVGNKGFDEPPYGLEMDAKAKAMATAHAANRNSFGTDSGYREGTSIGSVSSKATLMGDLSELDVSLDYLHKSLAELRERLQVVSNDPPEANGMDSRKSYTTGGSPLRIHLGNLRNKVAEIQIKVDQIQNGLEI